MTASPSAFRFALTCLRIVILVQCVGLAGRYVLSASETESDVYGLLFFDCGWPEAIAQRIDDVGAFAVLAAGCAIALAGLLGRAPFGKALLGERTKVIESLAAVVVAGWVLALAVSHSVRGGIYAELTLGERAVRYVAPLAFLLLLRCYRAGGDGKDADSKGRAYRIAVWAMVLASAATFAVHGYKALVGYGPFADLVLWSNSRFLGSSLSQLAVERSLWVIGIVDVVVAIALVATRWRSIAVYMAVWGGLTAASRMTAMGWQAWPETLMRAANFGVPMALAILLRPTKDS